MRIEHSPLFNDFIDFYFETSVDGEKSFETVLIYTQMQWETREIATGNVILSGTIPPAKDQTEEKIEEERIRNAVTTHLLNTWRRA